MKMWGVNGEGVPNNRAFWNKVWQFDATLNSSGTCFGGVSKLDNFVDLFKNQFWFILNESDSL